MNTNINSSPFRTFGETDLTIYTIYFLVISIVYFLFAQKRYSVLGIIPLIILVSATQRVVIAGLDFSPIRLVILAGFLRLIIRKEYRPIRFNSLDLLILLFCIILVINHTLQIKNFSAFIYQSGISFEILGLYFFFRFFFSSTKDIVFAIKIFTFLVVLISLFMIVEKITLRNQLSLFGASPIPEIREGRVRCTASFSHAILAGSFGAAVFPLILPLFRQKGLKIVYAAIGCISCLIIVYLSASSGPLFAFLSGIIASLLWYFRGYLNIIRWVIFIILIAMQLIMKGPIWGLIARVSAIGGSTGYHRYILIDQFIRNFSEWWLVGTTQAYTWDRGLFDTTNHFLVIAQNGGLLPLLLFILIIIFVFQTIGNAINYLETRSNSLAYLYWAIGVSIFVHITSFISVSYFDQNNLLLYLTIAFIASTHEAIENKTKLIRKISYRGKIPRSILINAKIKY